MSSVRAVGILLFMLLTVLPLTAQDVLREHKINGLRNITEVAIVVRPTDPDKQIEWRDLTNTMRVALAKDLPNLRIAEDAEKSPVWLQLAYMWKNEHFHLSLSVIRWVRMPEGGQTFLATTWSDEKFGATSNALKESVQTLVTSFAADYVRATQRRN